MPKKNKEFKPGDIVIVKVNGKPYETKIDSKGTQRWVPSPFIRWLFLSRKVTFEEVDMAYRAKQITKDVFIEFCIKLGDTQVANLEHRPHPYIGRFKIENPLGE